MEGNRMKKSLIAAAAIAALGLTALALPATASVVDTSAVTHTMDHPDTTSVAGTCTGTSPNGPVWAYDNLSLKLDAVQTGTDTYSVTITGHGSYQAFSDPITGACASFSGGVDGYLHYVVSSTSAPDPSNVPAKQPSGDTGQVAILEQLFHGNATITGGGDYSYTYTNTPEGKYTQHS